MSFKNIVVLGGGPIGLMCAIEAKQRFKNVTIVEKRSGGYTRTNVPQLQNPIVKHLNTIGVGQQLWQGQTPGSSVAFSRIEDSLWAKAQGVGVVMERGYFLEGIMGSGPRKTSDGRYKSMNLTVRQWDDRAKGPAAGGAFKALSCDLLIVAAGGSATTDPVMLSKLGFGHRKLKAKNYGAFGIFSTDGHQPKQETKLAVAPIATQMVDGKISFNTPDHNYLLVTLSKCTKSDFKRLQSNVVELRKILLGVGRTMAHPLSHIKDVQKNVGLFKITIQRAAQFYSNDYPAVIVGDAAVTPHPQAGSGIGTGFKGFQELQILLSSISQRNRAQDLDGVLLEFNNAYELHVSKKAIEGTIIVLGNLIKMVETCIADVQATTAALPDVTRGLGKLMKDMGDQMVAAADLLRLDFEQQRTAARQFEQQLDAPGAQLLDWDTTVGALWSDINDTYKAVKTLTAGFSLYADRLALLEEKLKFRDNGMRVRGSLKQ